jgi:hypothetical protein
VKIAILMPLATRQVETLLAKTKNFGQTQFLNPSQGFFELLALRIVFGQNQHLLMSAIAQLGRQHQEVGTNRIERSRQIFRWQSQPFEPMDDIGGEQKHLKKGDVGLPTMAGNFGQRIIVKEFAVVFLDSSSGVVKQVYAPRRHIEVGDENMINVFGIFEQSQLFGFLGVFGDRTAHNNKAMGAVPFLMDVGQKLAGFPTVFEFLVFGPLRLSLDSGIFSGDDDVTASRSVEKPDYSLTVKPRIHSKTDTTSGDIPGRFVQTNFQKADGSRGRSRVSRTQSPVPEFLAMRLETKQRMITSASWLPGVVADARALLPAVNGDHHRIDVEDQTGSFVRYLPEIGSEAVVQSYPLTNRLWAQALQKPSQSRLIGKATQPQNVQKESVVLQDLGFVDALHPHDDRVEQRQSQLGAMILGLFVTIVSVQTLLNSLLQNNLLAKTVNQSHSAKVRQVGSLEEKSNISGAFWHGTQTSHLVYFLSQWILLAYYTLTSSIKTTVVASKSRF